MEEDNKIEVPNMLIRLKKPEVASNRSDNKCTENIVQLTLDGDSDKNLVVGAEVKSPKKSITKHKDKFQKDWLVEFAWLEYKVEENKMYHIVLLIIHSRHFF